MALRTRAALIAMMGLALVVVPAGSATASGGGGCGKPVTNEAGNAVEIAAFCFTPTVLYTEPGETVTWTNQDGLEHNVLGANGAWGSFGSMRTGKKTSYTFSEPGVYAYVCTMHPGMVGTVVVGDPAPGEAMDARSVRRIKTLSATDPNVPAPSRSPESDVTLWLATSATVAAFGALAVGRRVRRRTR
jgi:plastocyanin